LHSGSGDTTNEAIVKTLWLQC